MTTVTSPMTGRVIGLAAVPDPVFSGAMVGPGTAIDPVREPSEAVAPVDGVIVSLHPHAFVVVDSEGHGVLTHLGIDTVQLGGEGFELLAAKGDTVKRGDAVVRWDPAAVERAGKSPVSPVVALEATAEALSSVAQDVELSAGDTLFAWN
ncbi:PTS glucose transporter subunit IIA [Streptomyces sp. TRM 70351]|uniref:PTS sugar transporter subunit IIA n=1 Tax=Streptomyces sp. TRM 70351 TaxID=3116552 RepID=UPI002E7BB3A2|nr:PTS glucose transporter subunit IIA [Streptomyces sp. TRM 70351]MEE1927302.1 PTS glucose transporter subunit IIA [Streptomyces sp. TRM 70351]